MTFTEILKTKVYPGRGIAVARYGGNAVIAYFIMGRSENSRNRIFEEKDGGVTAKAFDESKVVDPSLIIYDPVRTLDDFTIVTNGNQTDTVFDYLARGDSALRALCTRTFEPDPPHFTPRISAVVNTDDGLKYQMSILKSANFGKSAERQFFMYDEPVDGYGHFIHTYSDEKDGVLVSFQGEPVLFEINTGGIDEFTTDVWNALNHDNRISLFTRFISLATGETVSRIINRLS